MKITWLGNAGVRIETGGRRILFDPFVQLSGAQHPNSLDMFLEDEIIFITHGHFDHLMHVPALLEEGEATVFCSGICAGTLEKFTDAGNRTVLLKPGDSVRLPEIEVKALKGEHVVFDRRLVFETLNPLRLLRHAGNLPILIWASLNFPEGGETLAYEIRAEGKTILLLGSMGLCKSEEYPAAPDLLVLPYQGTSRLVETAEKILARIRPRRVMLTHFDDAFPPLTRCVDSRALRERMRMEFPQMRAVRPAVGKPVRL